MKLTEFDYELPDSLIAAFPSRTREGSRLLVIRRATGQILHSMFAELASFLDAGDLLCLTIPRFFRRASSAAKRAAARSRYCWWSRFPISAGVSGWRSSMRRKSLGWV